MQKTELSEREKERKFIISAVAHFASSELYDCYGVHATSDNYYTPDIAIGDSQLNEELVRSLVKRGVLAEKEGEIVSEFNRVLWENVEKIDHHSFEKFEEWLEQDPHWKRIQTAARKALQKLGADLKAWEDANIDWSKVGLHRPEKYRHPAGPSPTSSSG